MQNAKDSFYLALRDRLAVINPARQVTIAGQLRAGILVEANETTTSQPVRDVFLLRWGAIAMDTQLPTRLELLDCEIFYCTEGTVANEQMDRDRVLTEMDAELAEMLVPCSAPKQSVGTQITVPMATNIFWGPPVYGETRHSGTLLSRSVQVRVYALQEVLQNGGLEP